MAIKDSLRLFLVVFAIIATLPLIYVGEVTADNNVSRGRRLFHGGESSEIVGTPSLVSPNSAAAATSRQVDYEDDDYFENFDDSTVTESVSSSLAASQKLSWSDNDVDTEPAPGQASLVFVFDGSVTMFRDLQQLQDEVKNLVSQMNAWDRIPLFNYIFVPVSDSTVGPKFVTRNEEEFFEVIKNFKVSNGGGNCASQPILKAIERGIESSLPRSFVLVLTDTSASDQDLEASVLQSIQEKQSSIYFLLTGNCSDRAIYGKLSDASNGLLLEQEKRDLGNVLRKLPEVLYNQNVLLKLQRTSASFGGLELVVDNNIKMVTIGVSDRNTDLVITEPTGGVVEGEEVFQGNWKIIKIQSPPPGFWDLNIRSTAVPKTIRVVGLSELILDFGFSQAPLEFFNQSSFTPTLGMKNTLSIRAENSYNTPNLTKGQLSFPQSKESPIELSLKFNSTTQLFTTDSFEPPRSAFQLSVHGVDEQGIAINRILSRHIQAAIGSPPELLFNEESRKILAGSDFKVTCQIRSFGVASSLILKSDKTILRTVFSDADPKLVFEKKQLETGDSGIYSCSARNEFGTREKVMQLTVVPPPPQIELLGDAIEGKQELEIKCHLQERENLMWTVNGEKIQTILDRGSYECNRNSLVLKNLHRNMSGNYSCTANSSTQIAVNVQYPVQKLKTGSTTVVFEVGKPITINCGLIGNPKPTIQWFNYEAFRPNDRQELVSFAAEERFDGMSITCTGRNNLSLGPVNNEILLKRKLTVEIKQTPDPVEAGKSVTLGCKAPPDARIEWTINGLGLESFPSRVVERAQELTILRVSEDEPLLVECTMKTSFDSAKASKKIQVIPAPAPQQKTVAPVIDEKSFEDYYLLDEENDHISLNCRATGVPAPKVTWTRAAHLVTNGSKLNITLDMADGEYNCVAENSAGTAVKWLIVERQVAPVNVIEETVNLNEGDTLNYSCPIIRNQKVSPNDILWTSDRLNYRGDNLLLIHASPSDTGVYSCCLPKGSVCARVRIVVKAKRKQHEVINRYVEVSPGQHLNLQCEGFFSFGARFEWWKSGQQVDTARALILTGSMESEGAYKCLSFDESNEYEVQYQVAFKQPPEVIKISQDPMAIGQEVIECAATGHPQPVIAWLRGGRKVVSTTLIQYGKDMLIDSLKSGHLIVVGTDGQGYATKESESHFLLLRQQTQSEEQFGLLQRNNNRVSLKWIVPRKTEAAGTWTCVAMNKWGTRNQTINIQPHEQEGAKTPELLDGETEHETHAVVQGLPLILECRVGLTLGHQIRWSKSNRPLASSHRWTIKENGNKLIIWEVKLDDAGSFECAQESSTGSVKKSFLVQILEPPQIQQASRMSTDDVVNKLSVLKGHSTVLQCPINGSPEPKITWSQLHFAANRSRRLLPLNKEGRNLTILPKEQTEFYQCSGESSLGNSQALFEIETESRPSIKNQNLTKLTPKLFTSILLPCWTEGHPLPNITWYKNTKVLTPKLRIRISANSQVVKISNIRSEDDNGVYSCIARNYLGSVSKTFSVQVQLPTLLSPWTKWTNCSESCGLGTRQRTRECLFWNGQTASTDKTPQCAGEKMETEECLVRECPVDGVWSEWTPWSPCSATCKSNVVEPTPSIKYRHRDCANPAPAFGGSPCRGSSYQQEVCEVPFCPIDGGWSPFSDWSTCSASCGVGMQVRNRICSSPVPQFNGRECDGEAFEVKHCNEGICSQLISSPAATSPATATALATEWSLWSEWGECTAACGSGFKSRTRKCLTGNCAGENIEFQQCEGRHCEARLEEEKSYRWYLNPQARVDKYQATASISSSSSSSQEEDVDDEVEIEYGAEKLSLFHLPKQQHQKYPSNYFNPQVSITLESSIPLTKDVSSIHFASATATQQQQRETNGSSQSCGLGFEFRNGFCEDINECTSPHHDPVCSASQVCVNTRGGFACECDSGYEMFENAQKCVDIDECKRRIHDCSHTCINTPGSYYCECPKGFLLSDDFQTCREDVNKMELRNAPEEEVFYIESGHQHHCPEGYTLGAAAAGGKCEDVDECATLEENCNTDQHCLNTNGGYVCIPTACPESFTEKDDGTCIEFCGINNNSSTSSTSASLCSNGATVANTITNVVITLDKFEDNINAETPIHKLVAYDDNGRAQAHTNFHLQFNPTTNHVFQLRQWKQGIAFVFANELLEGRIYKLVVYGKTVKEEDPGELLYLHKFILHLYRPAKNL